MGRRPCWLRLGDGYRQPEHRLRLLELLPTHHITVTSVDLHKHVIDNIVGSKASDAHFLDTQYATNHGSTEPPCPRVFCGLVAL